MTGPSSQLDVFCLAHHDPPVLHLVPDYDEDIPSEDVFYLSLFVLQRHRVQQQPQGEGGNKMR